MGHDRRRAVEEALATAEILPQAGEGIAAKDICVLFLERTLANMALTTATEGREALGGFMRRGRREADAGHVHSLLAVAFPTGAPKLLMGDGRGRPVEGSTRSSSEGIGFSGAELQLGL